MGYYSMFEVSVVSGEYDSRELAKKCLQIGFYPFKYKCKSILNNKEYGYSFELTSDETKWYEHEDEMKKLSEHFPDLVFKLYQDGEITEDIYYKYFKNGKMQICTARIVFDEYDESKLE